MAAKTKKPTPAALAAARRNAAVTLPPTPPPFDGAAALSELRMIAGGIPYLIGPAVEGDPTRDATRASAETWTMTVRDRAGTLQAALSDENLILAGAVTITVNTIVYVLQSAVGDDTGLVTLVWEDEVAWRLRQFSSPLSVKRSASTRAEFIAALVDEAARPPMAPMAFFCPEIDDTQRIAGAPAARAPRSVPVRVVHGTV